MFNNGRMNDFISNFCEAAFFSNSTTEYIAAAFFQIETTKNAELDPPPASYGSRKKTSTRQERADGTAFTDY